jgi:negative regulator of genetic competence, sporulation and motility
MELIIIGENRLKIMLTCEDMARYELSEPCAETMGVRARRALRSIVADAHAQIGFDTDSERLLVQLFASREGGCEIFVTRLEEPGEVKLLRALSVEGDLSGGEDVRPLWLRLEALTDVTALCRRLMSAGYLGGGALYIREGVETVWYLRLAVPRAGTGVDPLPFLAEYGEEEAGAGLYLGERGRRLCGEGAVELLARL